MYRPGDENQSPGGRGLRETSRIYPVLKLIKASCTAQTMKTSRRAVQKPKTTCFDKDREKETGTITARTMKISRRAVQKPKTTCFDKDREKRDRYNYRPDDKNKLSGGKPSKKQANPAPESAETSRTRPRNPRKPAEPNPGIHETRRSLLNKCRIDLGAHLWYDTLHGGLNAADPRRKKIFPGETGGTFVSFIVQ